MSMTVTSGGERNRSGGREVLEEYRVHRGARPPENLFPRPPGPFAESRRRGVVDARDPQGIPHRDGFPPEDGESRPPRELERLPDPRVELVVPGDGGVPQGGADRPED